MIGMHGWVIMSRWRDILAKDPGMSSSCVTFFTVALVSIALGGCSSVSLTQTGAISSYKQLGPAKGNLGKARSFVEGTSVAAASTVAIVPTAVTRQAASAAAAESDARLVANAVDRAMCIALSDRFVVVRQGQHADLTVRSTVTTIVPTGKTAAGVSKVVTLGTSSVLPVGVPRLPMGLGGIAIEAEAVDLHGTQKAAITWSRGANSITNSARISEIGDAYGLAGTFGREFGKMLVTAKTDTGMSWPSANRIGAVVGTRPKNAVCDDFGRSGGIGRLAGSIAGAPPSWTDNVERD
jgi:hypothetical protein